MASGTRFRSRDRSREQGSSAPRSQRSAPPARAQGQTGALHLKVRPGQSGSFRLQRIVLLEIAAAAVLVGWIVGPFALMPAAVVAVALVLLAFVRRRGRSLPEWLATARALRARQRRAASTPIPPGTEPGLAPAVECDPGMRTSAYSARDRRPVGVIGDGTFVTAVLQVEADATALRAERSRQPLPLGLVRDTLDVDDIHLESAQIVLHTQPAPALHLPQQSVAVSNYAPLQEQTGAPAVRITWIALKLDPELCPEAVAARGVDSSARRSASCAPRTTSRVGSRGRVFVPRCSMRRS